MGWQSVTTIPRSVWVDWCETDDGVEPGTVLNNATLQRDIYDRIDQMMASHEQRDQKRAAAQANTPTGTLALAATLAAVAGTRNVSRRALLGLGWLRRHG